MQHLGVSRGCNWAEKGRNPMIFGGCLEKVWEERYGATSDEDFKPLMSCGTKFF